MKKIQWIAGQARNDAVTNQKNKRIDIKKKVVPLHFYFQ